MKCLLIGLVLILGACASSGDGKKGPVVAEEEDSNILVDTISDTFHGAVDTVQSPFRDLGLMEEDIPDQLEEVASNPYMQPDSLKCEIIMDELSDLDTILGADKYSPKVGLAGGEKKVGYWSEGSKMASNMAVSKLGSKVNVIPFRGIVRRVSGADAHDKAVKRAYEAGQLRRAYLRGVADAKGAKCKNVVITKDSLKNKKDIVSLD